MAIIKKNKKNIKKTTVTEEVKVEKIKEKKPRYATLAPQEEVVTPKERTYSKKHSCSNICIL